MKMLMRVLTVMLAVILLSACGSQKDTVTPNLDTLVPADAVLLPWGIAVCAEKVTSKGLELQFINISGGHQNAFETGRYFRIERETSNGWERVPLLPEMEGIVWPLDALIYRFSEKDEMSITWDTLYGPLVPGNYRLVKEFAPTEPTRGDWDHYEIPFTVKGQKTTP